MHTCPMEKRLLSDSVFVEVTSTMEGDNNVTSNIKIQKKQVLSYCGNMVAENTSVLCIIHELKHNYQYYNAYL